MEQLKTEHTLVKTKIKFGFDELLKPNKKYDINEFSKSGTKNLISKYILKDEIILISNKKSKYNKFLLNNCIFGAVIDIFKIFSESEILRKEFTLNFIANAFSKFDDKLNLDISMANEILYTVAEKNSSQENINEIKKYFEQYSQDDFKYFEFKNFEDYEFNYQWKKINSVINVYFSKINQEQIGKLVSLLFLISYESQKELKDFISSSLISNENLSEDFVLNKQNDLLQKIYNELITQKVSDIDAKEIFTKLLSIIPNYQLNLKHKNFFKKLFFVKKSGEKFRLYISDEIVANIGKTIKIIANAKKEVRNNFTNQDEIKILNKKFTVKSEEIQAAKYILLNADKIDYLSALSETYFKSKKLSFNKYKSHLTIIKLANLAYGYSTTGKKQNLKFNNAEKLFEILMLKEANLHSKAFAEKLFEVINQKKLIDDFIKEKIPNQFEFKNKMNNLIKVMIFIYKELGIGEKIILNTIRYYIIKNELYNYESNKKAKTIFQFEEVTISEASKWQNDLISEIENDFKSERSSIYIRYIRFMTETYGKLYLSDKPPMTTSQKIGLGVIYIVMSLWVLIILMPILQVFIQAVNWYSSNASTGQDGQYGSRGIFDFSNFRFSIANFSYLFSETWFKNWLINSLVIAIISMVFMVSIVALIGYAFSRFRFKGKKIGLMTVMLIQMVPTVSSFVAFFIMLQILQELVGMTGQGMLILIYTGGGIPGNVFVLKGYMDNISMDIDEAAKIDGCGNWKIFTRIIVPLAKPMLSVIALWSFIGPFGDVLLPQILLVNVSEYTMATGLRTLLSGGTTEAQGAFAAGSLVIAIPIAALFLGLQKNITGGLSAAGVKG